MSINYCTLASTTVDTFCGPRRGILMAKLSAELHPVVPPVPQSIGGNPRVVRNTFDPRTQPFQRPHYEIDDREPLKYEQPFVSVTVTLLGDSRTETQNVEASSVDIVTVTNLEFEDAEQIVVNTSDFSFD